MSHLSQSFILSLRCIALLSLVVLWSFCMFRELNNAEEMYLAAKQCQGNVSTPKDCQHVFDEQAIPGHEFDNSCLPYMPTIHNLLTHIGHRLGHQSGLDESSRRIRQLFCMNWVSCLFDVSKIAKHITY